MHASYCWPPHTQSLTDTVKLLLLPHSSQLPHRCRTQAAQSLAVHVWLLVAQCQKLKVASRAHPKSCTDQHPPPPGPKHFHPAPCPSSTKELLRLSCTIPPAACMQHTVSHHRHKARYHFHPCCCLIPRIHRIDAVPIGRSEQACPPSPPPLHNSTKQMLLLPHTVSNSSTTAGVTSTTTAA